MSNLGARAASALGIEAAFTDLCTATMTRLAQKPMVQQGMKIAKEMAKEVAKDTAFSEILDAVGLAPPPSVARASALSSVASAGFKGAIKETTNTVLGKTISEQKKAHDVKPFVTPPPMPNIPNMMNTAFNGLASMCAASMPAHLVSATGMPRSSPSQSFSGGVMDAFTRGPSAVPGLQNLVPSPSFNPAATAGSRAFFPGSFQQASKGAGGYVSPTISADIDRSPSGPSKPKI